MIVFGNDYNTPDGTCIRDYIHVVDLAHAHVKSIKYLTKNRGKHTFNIGTGNGLSVLEIIQAFEQSTQQNSTYQLVHDVRAISNKFTLI